MRFTDNPEDIVLAIMKVGSQKQIASAITRSRSSRAPDVRTIGAIAAIKATAVKASWIADWLAAEKSRETRCYLYIALASKNPALAKIRFANFSRGKMNSVEAIYYLAGMCIAYRTREYLLDIMKLVFSNKDEVSEKAQTVIKMLVDKNDNATLKFVEMLRRERKRQLPSK